MKFILSDGKQVNSVSEMGPQAMCCYAWGEEQLDNSAM